MKPCTSEMPGCDGLLVAVLDDDICIAAALHLIFGDAADVFGIVPGGIE